MRRGGNVGWDWPVDEEEVLDDLMQGRTLLGVGCENLLDKVLRGRGYSALSGKVVFVIADSSGT